MDVDGYLGKYISSHTLKDIGTISWADLQPEKDITEISIKNLNPIEVLRLAKIYDCDIDGKTGSSSAIIKEGEEKFIDGASYTGTQGVSISEVSGISASIIHGKRVSWTRGDTLSNTKGNEYSTHIETADLDYFANATRSMSKKYHAKDMISSYTTAAAIITNKVSVGEVLSATVATDITKAYLSRTKSKVTLTGLDHKTSAGISSYANSIFGRINSNSVATRIMASNIATERITIDRTNLTVQISSNISFNVARNTFDAFDKTASTAGIEINEREKLINKKGLIINKVSSLINNVTNKMITGEFSIETQKLKISETEQSNKINKIATEVVEIRETAGRTHTNSTNLQIIL